MAYPDIDRKVIELFALVGDGFAGATEALLRGDRLIAEALIERDNVIDALYKEVEASVSARLAAGGLETADIGYLVAILRIVPELERSGDLAEHIAQKSLLGLMQDMTPRIRGIIDQMGQTASSMWRRAAEAYEVRDEKAFRIIDSLDDEIDDLTIAFYVELASTASSIVAAIEMSLVGRFYERFADHAVNLARAITQLPKDSSTL